MDLNLISSKSTISSEQAIAELIGEQFIAWLLNYVSFEIHNLPPLQAVVSLQPKIEKLRKLMIQQFLARQAFGGTSNNEPGFLGFAIANLSETSDPEAEPVLGILEHKQQEEIEESLVDNSLKKNHRQKAWIKLLKLLGASIEEIYKTEPKEWTRNYIAELSDLYSNGEWQEVAGAFAAHERVIPEEYAIILPKLNQVGIKDFDLSSLLGHTGRTASNAINGGHILDKIVFDSSNKQLIFAGVQREIIAHHDFWVSALKYLES